MVLSPLTSFFFTGEENTQSPKQATKCKVYFYHLFLKVMHWTSEMRLWQSWENIFDGNPMFPFNERRLSFKYFCFQKIFWKWSSAQVGYGFENHALLFCWKYKFFSSKSRNDSKNSFSRLTPQIFFSASWSVVKHTWLLNNFAKRQRNYWNSKNDNRRKKLFRKRNLFSTKFFSGSANLCWLNPEKNSWLKDPFFFISKSEEGWNHVHFQ